MLGIKLMLLGIALLLFANACGGIYTIVFLFLGMIPVVIGLFVKDKKNTKEQ